MRRTEIAEGAQQIIQAVKESGIDSAMDKMFEGRHTARPSDAPVAELLGALRQYSLYAHKYNGAAKRLAHILDLSNLENPKLWSELINLENQPVIYSSLRDLRFAIDYLPKIIEMVEPEPSDVIQHAINNGKSLLSVVIIEEDNRFSSPARLSNVLESVQLLYEACAIMNEMVPEGLSVVACDSGSDKSFDFLGVAKVIECVKEVILSLWDRVVFFRERKFSERIDLIAKSLPVIDRIGELEQDKKLGPEQAEILRRNIFEGVHKFTESGAIIPEIEERTHYNPRLLMSPIQKLLTSASNEIASSDDGGKNIENGEVENRAANSDLSALSDTEREELFRLLEKTKRKNAPNLQEELNESE